MVERSCTATEGGVSLEEYTWRTEAQTIALNGETRSFDM
jgi:hypothetical protein